MINETLEKLKVCGVCKMTLPLSEFYTRKRSGGERGLRAQCKQCAVKAVVHWGKQNPVKKKINQKKYAVKHRKEIDFSIEEWRKANPDKMRLYAFNGYKSHLKKKFGITIEDYDAMYIEQGGRCAICGTHQSKLVKRLCVDHCHETQKVRGLLCDRCNTGISRFKDNINLLQNAIKYLREADNE